MFVTLVFIKYFLGSHHIPKLSPTNELFRSVIIILLKCKANSPMQQYDNCLENLFVLCCWLSDRYNNGQRKYVFALSPEISNVLCKH